MKKTQKLKKVSINMGNGTFTYYVNPNLNLPKIDDSPIVKKKLENAKRTLGVAILPPGLARK